LRENAYHRIFQKTSAHESQRENWLDVQVRLRWGKEELETLVDNRLHELFRRRIHPDTSDVSVDTAGDSQAQWQDRD
jgi:hypothetical protein